METVSERHLAGAPLGDQPALARIVHGRSLNALGRTIPVASLAVACFGAVLLSVEVLGVVVWVTVCAVAALTLGHVHTVLRRRNDQHHPVDDAAELRRDRLALDATLAVNSFAWGALPIVVSPADDRWLAVSTMWIFAALALLTQVCSSSRRTYVTATVPLVLTASIGLLTTGGTFGAVLTLLVVTGAAYSTAMYGLVHSTAREAATAELQRSIMVDVLSAERRRLARVNELLELEATHDPLTGLLNRAGLKQLTAEMRMLRVASVGVVVIDLDGFKAVNDTWGHHSGDAVLAELARRWSRAMRTDDSLVRVGGDEFLLVAPGVPDDEVAARIAERMSALVLDPVEIDDLEIPMSCSVGSAAGSPDRLDELIAEADTRLYDTRRSNPRG